MASKSLSTTVDNGMQQLTTPSNFKFSGTTIDQLGASEYTIATIVLDASGSVGSFKPELKKAPFKYRNINKLDTFTKFCHKNLDGCVYANLYDKETRVFIKRIVFLF